MKLFEVGDLVMHVPSKRQGSIIDINDYADFPIRVEFSNGEIIGFLADGRFAPNDNKPSLFMLTLPNEAKQKRDPLWMDLVLVGLGLSGGYILHFLQGVPCG